jgi:hypothetical protein
MLQHLFDVSQEHCLSVVTLNLIQYLVTTALFYAGHK